MPVTHDLVMVSVIMLFPGSMGQLKHGFNGSASPNLHFAVNYGFNARHEETPALSRP